MQYVNLYYGDGQLRYESDAYVGGIEIECSGNFHATSEESGNFLLQMNKNKIIYLNLDSSKNPLPNILFNYSGSLIITSALCTSDGKAGFKANIVNKSLTSWDDLKDVKYSDLDVKWSSMNYNYHVGNQTYSERKFVRQNQYSNGEDIGYEDETPYYGFYHTHGDGTMMTGKVHDEDSENLYYIKKKEKIDVKLESMKEKKLRKRKKVINVLSEMKKQGVKDPSKLKGVDSISGESSGMQRIGEKTSDTTPTSGGGGSGGTP